MELEESLRRERDALKAEQDRSDSLKAANGTSQESTPTRNGSAGGYTAGRDRLSYLFNTPTGRSQAVNGSTFGGSAPPKFSFTSKSAKSALPSLEKLTLERMKDAQRKKMEEEIKHKEAEKERV